MLFLLSTASLQLLLFSPTCQRHHHFHWALSTGRRENSFPLTYYKISGVRSSVTHQSVHPLNMGSVLYSFYVLWTLCSCMWRVYSVLCVLCMYCVHPPTAFVLNAAAWECLMGYLYLLLFSFPFALFCGCWSPERKTGWFKGRWNRQQAKEKQRLSD